MWGPLDRPIEAPGGAVVVSAETDDDLARLAGACGAVASPQAVAERLGTLSPQSWDEALAAAGVPVAPVSSDLARLASDPRLPALFEPMAADGSCRAPASPWRLSA